MEKMGCGMDLTVNFSILLNGTPSGFFQPSRGFKTKGLIIPLPFQAGGRYLELFGFESSLAERIQDLV